MNGHASQDLLERGEIKVSQKGSRQPKKLCESERSITDEKVLEFWSKVNKNGPTMPHMDTPCWVWMASTNNNGYGLIQLGEREVRSHRLSWLLENNDPGELCVLHKCDNPPCVRPSHLWLGTNADNMADKTNKGRLKGDFGDPSRGVDVVDLGRKGGSARTDKKRAASSISLEKAREVLSGKRFLLSCGWKEAPHFGRDMWADPIMRAVRTGEHALCLQKERNSK